MAKEKSFPERDITKNVTEEANLKEINLKSDTPEPEIEKLSEYSESRAGVDAGADTASLNTQVDELKEALMRAQADLQNVRRRAVRDIENAHKYAVEKFIKDLLAVLDSMDRALEVAEATEGFDPAMLEGTQMTHKLLLDTAAKHGVEPLDPIGEVFNPKEHQAMSMVESAEYDINAVMAVMQKGYKLEGRVIRAAMVVVAKAVSD